MIKRRAFITLLGGAAAAWPLEARAQQPERVRHIGMLVGYDDPAIKAFQQELERLGWFKGRNIHIDYRYAPAATQVRTLAKELVGGSLYRKIARLVAAQDSIDIRCCLPVLILAHECVGHETASGDEETVGIDRWQPIVRSERSDEIAIDAGRAVRHYDHAAVWDAGGGSNGALDVHSIVLNATGHQFDTQGQRGSLTRMEQMIIIDGGFRISQKCDACSAWCDLL